MLNIGLVDNSVLLWNTLYVHIQRSNGLVTSQWTNYLHVETLRLWQCYITISEAGKMNIIFMLKDKLYTVQPVLYLVLQHILSDSKT